jgi:hypothetical protein
MKTNKRHLLSTSLALIATLVLASCEGIAFQVNDDAIKGFTVTQSCPFEANRWYELASPQKSELVEDYVPNSTIARVRFSAHVASDGTTRCILTDVSMTAAYAEVDGEQMIFKAPLFLGSSFQQVVVGRWLGTFQLSAEDDVFKGIVSRRSNGLIEYRLYCESANGTDAGWDRNVRPFLIRMGITNAAALKASDKKCGEITTSEQIRTLVQNGDIFSVSWYLRPVAG